MSWCPKLGPFLDLIFVNKLKNSASILDLGIFADDTDLFYVKKMSKHKFETVNNELQCFNDWSRTNKIFS